jgi:hypothetical protein
MATRAPRWGVEFLQRHAQEDPKQAAPGRDFLDEIPAKVAARMVAVLEAVRVDLSTAAELTRRRFGIFGWQC